MAKPLLYDGFGNEITYSERPPAENLADIGRVRDPWAGRATGDISPESLARLLKGDAELADQMMLAKRLLNDPHLTACMRNLAHSIARLPWEVLPYDESREAKKDAEELTAFLKGLPWLHRMIRTLVYGEFYTFVGVGLKWNNEYGIDGFTPVDPVRWTWDRQTNALRLRTLREQTKGEPIDPRGFVLHSSALEPGTIRDAGLWKKAAWLWLFKNTTWAYWVRFAENFGNPMIWAFFNRKEDKDSVLEAVTGMAANARGAFPVGTEIKIQEAQRYGTTALYQAIINMAEAGMTKLIQGHTLNTDATSGAGTLAGNAAADVAQENKEGVGTGIKESVQGQLITSWYLFHRGEEQVKRGQMSRFELRTDPPEDLEKKSKVYVSINEALASAGRTIDPEQIESEFAVRTIELPKSQETPVNPDPDSQDPKAARRRAAAKKTKIETVDDVGRAGAQLVTRAAEEFSERIAEIFENADSIEAGVDALWEGYGAMETTRLASAVRDVAVTANLIGRGDVSE